MGNENRAFGRAARRLVPFMVLLYLASFLDRVNVSFAALTMNADLKLSATAYGIGGGIFFFGYFLFEVPSNVIMERVGARAWIFRIMLTWGLVSMATAFVRDAHGFYLLRFLLGLAEAGFFPGMVLYLTYWFPQSMRARFFSMFLAAVPLASVIGAPLSSFLLGLEGLKGLHGWQWLFLLEGLPSCILAFAVLVFLPDGPSSAHWLSKDEKALILSRIAEEAPPARELWAGLSDLRIWLLAVAYFGIVTGLYGIGLWLPQMVKAMGFSIVETGLLVALPSGIGIVAMILWGYSSDMFRERVAHVALAALLGAGGLAAAALERGSVLSLVALSFAAIGIYAALSTFWTLPASFLGGTAAASGIAFINAISNLGGFLGPTLVGWLKETTGNYDAGMGVLAAGLIVTAFVVIILGRYLSFEVRARLFDRFAPPT